MREKLTWKFTKGKVQSAFTVVQKVECRAESPQLFKLLFEYCSTQLMGAKLDYSLKALFADLNTYRFGMTSVNPELDNHHGLLLIIHHEPTHFSQDMEEKITICWANDKITITKCNQIVKVMERRESCN